MGSSKFKPSKKGHKNFDDGELFSDNRKNNKPKFRQVSNRRSEIAEVSEIYSALSFTVPTPTIKATIVEPTQEPEPAVVKWFDAKKGYGFVQTNKGDKDLFMHISVLLAINMKTIEVGTKINILRGPGKKNSEIVVKIVE
jgi:cold shock CspA family protein